MNKWATHDLFGPMRSSTIKEQQLYYKMLEKYSIPIGRSIWNMNDIEVNYCDICHKKKQIKRKYYYYDINCDCCGSPRGHFEIVKYCDECIPKPSKRINIIMEPYND